MTTREREYIERKADYFKSVADDFYDESSATLMSIYREYKAVERELRNILETLK